MNTDRETAWRDAGYANALELLLERVDGILERADGRFPLFASQPGGEWVTSRRGSWISGCWVGLLWLRAHLRGRGRDADEAARWAEKLGPRVEDDTAHRALIFWYGTAPARLFGENERMSELATAAANALAASFRPEVGIIPLGTAMGGSGHGGLRSTVDPLAGMLRLLSWTNDRAHLQRARAHLDRHLEVCLRSDGAVAAHLSQDPTGRLRADLPPGEWSRGQAWALLALADTVQVFGDDYREAALAVTEYWLRTRPGLPPDTLARPDAAIDTSAASIAALGLLKMAPHHPGARIAARDIVDTLVTEQLASHLDTRGDPGTLLNGCYETTPGHRESVETVWGTFFLAWSLGVLLGRVPVTSV